MLTAIGLKEEEGTLLIDKGAPYNEKSWACRFPAVFMWLVENQAQLEFVNEGGII